VPKKCGHKNCIPSEHWSHSKGKKWNSTIFYKLITKLY
jgi:hypothetical protein